MPNNATLTLGDNLYPADVICWQYCLDNTFIGPTCSGSLTFNATDYQEHQPTAGLNFVDRNYTIVPTSWSADHVEEGACHHHVNFVCCTDTLVSDFSQPSDHDMEVLAKGFPPGILDKLLTKKKYLPILVLPISGSSIYCKGQN